MQTEFFNRHPTINHCFSIGEALITTCKSGDLDLCREIIDKFPIGAYDYDLCMIEAFEKACLNNHLDLCKYLVTALPNLRDECLYKNIYIISTSVAEKENFTVLMWMIETWPHLQNCLQFYTWHIREAGDKNVAELFMSKFESQLTNDADLMCCLNNEVDLKAYINKFYSVTKSYIDILTYCGMSSVKIVDTTELTVTLHEHVLYEMLKISCKNRVQHVAKWLMSLYNNTDDIFKIFTSICKNNSTQSAKFMCELWPDMAYIYIDSEYNPVIPFSEYPIDDVNDVFLRVCLNNNYELANYLYEKFTDIIQHQENYLINVVFLQCLLHKDINLVKFLYEIFDIEIEDFLHYAITWQWISNADNLDWLISLRPELDTFMNNQRLLVLMCEKSDLVDIKLLIERQIKHREFIDLIDDYVIHSIVKSNRLEILQYLDETWSVFMECHKNIHDLSLYYCRLDIIRWLSTKCNIDNMTIYYESISYTPKPCKLVLYLTSRNHPLKFVFDRDSFNSILINSTQMIIEWFIKFYTKNDVGVIITSILKYESKSVYEAKYLISFVMAYFDIEEIKIKKEYRLEFEKIMHQIQLERTNIKSAAKN